MIDIFRIRPALAALSFALAIWFCWTLSCDGKNKAATDFALQRETMVKTQIEARGVKDELVLKAMRKVERHKFVTEEDNALAYSDRPLPIGESQTISQPYIVAI